MRLHITHLSRLSLCPYRDTKLNISTFFRDMFSLPNADAGASSVNDSVNSVNVEETAYVIERILNGMSPRQYDLPSPPTLEQLHGAVRAHDKFDITINRSHATAALRYALSEDPWTGLAYASHINDLALGRMAIELMGPGDIDGDGCCIWESLSDLNVKPTWQIAFLKLILLDVRSDYSDKDNRDQEHGKRVEYAKKPIVFSSRNVLSMADIAAQFDPKSVHYFPTHLRLIISDD